MIRNQSIIQQIPEYPLPLSSKDRGDLELVPYYNEHPLVNEAIRQLEQLQKQQEKKKHRDVRPMR